MSLAADRVPSQRSGWRSFDLDEFVADFELFGLVVDPPSDVTELFSCYSTITLVE